MDRDKEQVKRMTDQARESNGGNKNPGGKRGRLARAALLAGVIGNLIAAGAAGCAPEETATEQDSEVSGLEARSGSGYYIDVKCQPIDQSGTVAKMKGRFAVGALVPPGYFDVSGKLEVETGTYGSPLQKRTIQASGQINKDGSYLYADVHSGAPDLEQVQLMFAPSDVSYIIAFSGILYRTGCSQSVLHLPPPARNLTWTTPYHAADFGNVTSPLTEGKTLSDIVNSVVSGRADGVLCSQCHYSTAFARSYRTFWGQGGQGNLGPNDYIGTGTTLRAWSGAGGFAEGFLLHYDTLAAYGFPNGYKPQHLRDLVQAWIDSGSR
jgi:hypothetical protein